MARYSTTLRLKTIRKRFRGQFIQEENEMTKPRVAIFDFTGCEGDQLQIANLEEDILDVLDLVDVVNWREVITERSDNYDVAVIEGSCTRSRDEERLKKIRAKASFVIAIGSCATIGGINCLRNIRPLDQIRREVYGDNADLFETYEAKPIDAVIKVDANVHGCPIDRQEFLSIAKQLLAGQKPFVPNYPVCVECKANDNVCVYEKGMTCMGPVSRAGCNSCCVNEGALCWGCRGPIDDPNNEAHKEVLDKYGLTVEEIANKFNLYHQWYKPLDEKPPEEKK
jgi:coenzyme F420-reducing hydrogenase gamma subunit